MSRYHYWVLLTLVLSALPCFFNLPLWVAFIALVGGGLHFTGGFRKKLLGKAVSITLLVGAATGIYYGFESWFSGEAVLSFFIVVVFLKWGESSTRRDYLLLIFAAVILAAVGALYWETLLSLIHMLVVVFSLTVSLIAIHMDQSVARSLFLIKRAGLLFILGLPLMLLLFMTFPRIPGPIWDIGLAFGLPIKAMMDRGNGEFGKSKVLQPGGISRSKEANGNVLVAEFEGAVPYKSQLYWRGPVFWNFDGENWTLPQNWDNRNTLLQKAIKSKLRLDRELRHRGTEVHYTLRVMPNGGRWLYALDVPGAPAPEAFVSDEFQLLSIRKIAENEPKFPMVSYLDYAIGERLTSEQKDRGVAWSIGTNPRLKSLGEELGKSLESDKEIIHEGLALLRKGKYRYDDSYIIEPGPDMLDRFFFDEKKGGAEYLAGSFAMLMRAAGIPARLVSGFRGGTIIALTNFVIVKQSDAHVWLEVWQDDVGWSRVEPKDIVLPPEKRKVTEQTKVEKVQTIELEKEDELNLVETKKHDKPKKNTSAAKPENTPGWQLPDLSFLFGDMQKWVINYDPDRQMELLKGAGFEDSNWLDMLIGAIAGVALILLLYLGIAWWCSREKVDRFTRTWRNFCKQLEKKFDLRKEASECPGNFLERICHEKPELKEVAEDIVTRYINIRYGTDESKESRTLFARQVQRFISMT